MKNTPNKVWVLQFYCQNKGSSSNHFMHPANPCSQHSVIGWAIGKRKEPEQDLHGAGKLLLAQTAGQESQAKLWVLHLVVESCRVFGKMLPDKWNLKTLG